jgi:hypothetical protein
LEAIEMTATLVIAAALALGMQAQQQQQQPPPAAPVAAAQQQADAPKAVMFTGCVIAAPDREDSFQLVPAEADAARAVGTSGSASPAWTVPAYLLLGGNVNAEHLMKTVEITGTIDVAPAPTEAAAPAAPKKTGDTTSRTQQAAAPMAQMHVQAVKVVAASCTPKKAAAQAKDK